MWWKSTVLDGDGMAGVLDDDIDQGVRRSAVYPAFW